jgi:hypothetical protein
VPILARIPEIFDGKYHTNFYVVERMRVIFTDHDGVLIKFTAANKKMRPAQVSEEAVAALNAIAAEYDVRIVVTSDWRANSSIEALRDCYMRWGVDAQVIGKTPVRQDKMRGLEIQDWLRDCSVILSSPLESFVIFDDVDSDICDLFLDRVVLTDPLLGFSWRDAVRCMRILAMPLKNEGLPQLEAARR